VTSESDPSEEEIDSDPKRGESAETEKRAKDGIFIFNLNTNRHEKGGCDKSDQGSARNRIKWLEIVGVALVLTYTVFQGAQLIVSRDTEYRQLRAYLAATSLTVSCCELPDVSVPNTQVVETTNAAHSVIRNGGLTPAKVSVAVLNWQPIGYDTPYPSGFAYTDYKPQRATVNSTSVILPGLDATYTWIINPDLVKSAQVRQSRLVFYGHADYTDALGKTHSLEYCWIYEGHPDGHPGTTTCPEHNGDRTEAAPWYGVLFSWLF
jgi:hypothetical protein